MNSVDTGWVTDEDPAEFAARKTAEHRFHPPLDIVDGAARIVDPIIDGTNTGVARVGLLPQGLPPHRLVTVSPMERVIEIDAGDTVWRFDRDFLDVELDVHLGSWLPGHPPRVRPSTSGTDAARSVPSSTTSTRR